MVKLRSQRFGSKKKPFYRIVATDSHNPRDGRYIEIVGTYNPLTEPATVKSLNRSYVSYNIDLASDDAEPYLFAITKYPSFLYAILLLSTFCFV